MIISDNEELTMNLYQEMAPEIRASYKSMILQPMDLGTLLLEIDRCHSLPLPHSVGLLDFSRVCLLTGRGAARAEDAHGTPTQSYVSPSILLYEDENGLTLRAGGRQTLLVMRSCSSQIGIKSPVSSS